MHRLFFSLLTAAFLMSSSAHAQFRKIPAAVTDSFKMKYPSATAVEWKDKVTSFQASFILDNVKFNAKYSSKGEWQGSTKDIKETELPAVVKDGLAKSKYADWKVRGVSTRYLPDGKTQYGIGVSKSDLQKKNLLFSSEGQLLKDNATL